MDNLGVNLGARLGKWTGHAAAMAALLTMAAPAQAQFGGLFGSRDRSQAEEDAPPEDCQDQPRSDAGTRIVRGILGGIAGDAARSAGIPYYVPVGEFTDQLSTAIACRLDPEEQRQAAEATVSATRGTEGDERAQIGATSSWQSTTRDDVTGTSTVVAREEASVEGMDCITVSDVVIVSGEETRADKRMCRAPGAARYSIVA